MADELILGRGRIYFDRFVPGTTTKTGELYFGNTPELSKSQSIDSLDHYSSEAGIKELDGSVDIQVTAGVTFKCDNISLENLALWVGGSRDLQTIGAVTGHAQTLTDVKLDRYYQLGEDADRPQGYRNLANLTVHIASTLVNASGNYSFDADLGRLYINADAADINDGDDLILSYDITAQTADVVMSGNSSLYGALRFISDNPVGQNRDYYWPYVKLSSDGDFALKGDAWQEMGFTGKVLKRDNNTAREYIDGRASTN